MHTAELQLRALVGQKGISFGPNDSALGHGANLVPADVPQSVVLLEEDFKPEDI